jgi:hypothetical protein
LRWFEDACLRSAVEALEREVNNGGYDQFFFNSSEFTPVIVQALNAIRCPGVAELAQDAIDALGIEGTPTIEAVNRVMEEDSDEREQRLDTCDDRYYREAGDLSVSLSSCIRGNGDEISLNE